MQQHIYIVIYIIEKKTQQKEKYQCVFRPRENILQNQLKQNMDKVKKSIQKLKGNSKNWQSNSVRHKIRAKTRKKPQSFAVNSANSS